VCMCLLTPYPNMMTYTILRFGSLCSLCVACACVF